MTFQILFIIKEQGVQKPSTIFNNVNEEVYLVVGRPYRVVGYNYRNY